MKGKPAPLCPPALLSPPDPAVPLQLLLQSTWMPESNSFPQNPASPAQLRISSGGL